MKVRLLHPDRDAELHPAAAPGDPDLITDLDLQPVLDLMVPTRLLKDVPHTLLRPLTDPQVIAWRQRVVADALAHPAVVRGLFDLAEEALERQRASWAAPGRTAESLLANALTSLTAVLPSMRELSHFARQHRAMVSSPGLSGLFERLIDELDAEYLDEVAAMLAQLHSSSASVARARMTDSVLVGSLELLAPQQRRTWRNVLGLGGQGRFRFTVPVGDDAGTSAVEELRNEAIFEVSVVLAEAAHHVTSFFRQLRWEAGFVVGATQLAAHLTAAGVPLCWPDPLTSTQGTVRATGLVNLSLSVRAGKAPVPNDVVADARPLTVFTGANQGGKTTLLRSLGCAQLLMQSGLFVPADAFTAEVAPAMHTHFRGAEEQSLQSGRLDDELRRMSSIIDRCHRGDLVMMNEPFASTDEIEGSYIGEEIIDALLRHGLRVMVVTHLHALASRYLDRPGTLFLRAERLPDGRRTYRVLPDRPKPTSHGLDIYESVFGDPLAERPPGP